MIELPLEIAQSAISRAWKMWLDQKQFDAFRVKIDDQKVPISYRLRGKTHEFGFPSDCCLSRGEIRELKHWWETESRGAVLMPVQQKSPGHFGTNAYFRSAASGAAFNFLVPVRPR